MRLLDAPPPREPTVRVRIVSTNDLLGTFRAARTSYGTSGTASGIERLVHGERQAGPTLWLDSGDFTGGPGWSLTGDRGWDSIRELSIDAAAAGNHEFDGGVAALLDGANSTPFPILCANVRCGLPPSVLLDTPNGTVGVVGLTHRAVHLLSRAPAPDPGWCDAAIEEIHGLRRQGADWVVVLHHDGADWWPSHSRDFGADAIAARATRWLAESAAWAQHADVVLGGHTLGAWHRSVRGTPHVQAYPFAASAAVVDLGRNGTVRVRGLVSAGADHPGPDGAAETLARRLADADTRVVGTAMHNWYGNDSHRHYLPDLIARAVRVATDVDAAFIPAHALFTQAPIDGSVSFLGRGPVSELDLHRLFPFPDDAISVVELTPREFRQLIHTHNATTSPSAVESDGAWWNWNRARAGSDYNKEYPTTVAVPTHTVALVAEWLDRDPVVSPTAVRARQALRALAAR